MKSKDDMLLAAPPAGGSAVRRGGDAGFQPKGHLVLVNKAGRRTSVLKEGVGQWVVTSCVCALCGLSCRDLFTVTHVATTYAAIEHLGLAAARGIAKAFNDSFPKFRSLESRFVKSQDGRELGRRLIDSVLSLKRNIPEQGPARGPDGTRASNLSGDSK